MKNKNELIRQLEELKHDAMYLDEMKSLMEAEDNNLTKIYTNLRHMKEMDLDVGNLDVKVKSILEKFVKGEKNLIHALEKRQGILTKIDTMSQPYKNVLYFRYVGMCTFDEIADKMKYSTKRIYQLHQSALQMYCDRFKGCENE